MAFFDEFRKFIARGNVVDLAVGVVIGGAFGKITTALVDGIIMPVIGWLTGGIKTQDWKLVLKAPELGPGGKIVAGEIALRYGLVLQAAIDFLLIALVIFTLLRAYNRLREPDTADPPKPAEDVLLLREIRDLLAGRPASGKDSDTPA